MRCSAALFGRFGRICGDLFISKELIYLDFAATTPLNAGARGAMHAALDMVGNPSSVHRAGRAARDAVDQTRAKLANCLGVGIGQVVFTSGGTEANAIALTQVPFEQRYCSSVEHEAVLAWVPEDNILPTDSHGVLDLNRAQEVLSNAAPGLVSVMLVNNTLGTLQPIQAICEIAKSYGHLMHCDAVQGFGKVPLDFAALGADFLSVSAHKIGGPKGVGALIVRDGFALQSFTKGGGQERRRRPGTENVVGIAGFGGALSHLSERLEAVRAIDPLRQRVLDGVGPDHLIGADAPRVPHILSLHMPGVRSELQLMRFDLAGICLSAGSACSSGKVTQSHVIQALGNQDEAASQSIRVSFGPETTPGDVDAFVREWVSIRQSVRTAA